MTRLLHKDINWNFNPLIDMNLLRFEKKFDRVDKDQLNPVFISELDRVNLKLMFAGIFYSPPRTISNVHVDSLLDDASGPWPNRIKINWTNVATTTTKWYDISVSERTNGTLIRTDVNSNFVKFNNCKKVLLGQANLVNWHLFESGVPHGVMNFSQDLRWCISCVVQDKTDNLPWPSTETLLERLCR